VKRHGGKRDGAGRHPVTHKKQRCNVTLAPDVLEILKTLCNGNRSAAIEFVSRQWQSLTPREPPLPSLDGKQAGLFCEWCEHGLAGNSHGVDQADFDGTVYRGKCKYCNQCYAAQADLFTDAPK
jgi:hypothetical protein